jgi:hypothetical protein
LSQTDGSVGSSARARRYSARASAVSPESGKHDAQVAVLERTRRRERDRLPERRFGHRAACSRSRA